MLDILVQLRIWMNFGSRIRLSERTQKYISVGMCGHAVIKVDVTDSEELEEPEADISFPFSGGMS